MKRRLLPPRRPARSGADESGAPRIPVGPFRLTERLGHGGMGEVWSGVHKRSGHPVAVKLVRVQPGAGTLAAFREEVRAVAGLDHPNVVFVLDHGELDVAAATALGAAAGSPWLAMELLPDGSLAEHQGELPWVSIRRALLQLLDALAHAHARGIVHRDLKPANVLLDGRGGVKLADFGLAHLVADVDAAELPTSGTPSYMAPEQCTGDWRAFGPWTDLYALGCLAWVLVTGRPVFVRSDTRGVLLAQLGAAPPRLEPRCVVPDGLEGWLLTLLEKEPAHRFRFAADAADALLQLGDVALDTTTRATEAAQEPTMSYADHAPATRPARAATRSRPRAAAPAADWRRPDAPARPPALHGAGLGLYGLRALPLVGRVAERDRLWGALLEVHATGRPRAVVIRGPSGCGKSRLAAWLRERAHEAGGATTLRAVHDPNGGPASGLVPMIERALRVRDLDPRLLEDQLAVTVPGAAPELAPRLASLATDPAAGQARTMDEVVEALATDRPVLVELDDAQWGAASLRWALAALRASAPVLVVLTVRDEALPERPIEHALLERILERPETSCLTPGALTADESSALVRELLPLDDALAARIEARVGGNPLFAVQLVGDWVSRGLLKVGPQGFGLRAGPPPALPDDLHAVWAARIDRVLSDRVPADRVALRVAALLGQEVASEEWRVACVAAGVVANPKLVQELQLQRLATVSPDHDGWAFVHGMLRESVAREAEAAGAADLHRACARALEALGDPHLGRAAEHLIAAGDVEAGLHRLTQYGVHLYNDTDGPATLAVADRVDQLAAKLGHPEEHPWRLEALTRRSAALRLLGDHDAARRAALAAVERADRAGDLRSLGAALHHLGAVYIDQERFGHATMLLRRAVAVTADAGNRASYLLSLVTSLQGAGLYTEAEAACEEALSLASEVGVDTTARMRAHEQRSRLALRRGAWADADADAARADELAQELGLEARRVVSLVNRGEAARGAGDLPAAEAFYEEAAAVERRVGGTRERDLVRLNLALLRLARGDRSGARSEATALLADRAFRGGALVRAVASLVLAATAADEATWARHVDASLEALQGPRLAERDIADLALQAAEAGKDPGRREALGALAREELRLLGVSEGAS